MADREDSASGEKDSAPRDRPSPRVESPPGRHVGPGTAAGPERPRRRAGSDGLPAGFSAAEAARRAARQVGELTGRDPEAVVAVERAGPGWRVDVEVVEAARIPDSADILAVYETELDADGELVAYRRVRRYSRGRTHEEPR